MALNIIATIFLAFFITLTPFQARSQEREDAYRVESKYKVDSLRVSDLYLQAIREKSQYNNFSKAYSIFKEILSIDSLHAPTLFHIAQIGNNPEKSLVNIENALSSDPNNKEYQYVKINALRSMKRYQEAINTLDNLIENDSKNASLFFQKAKIYDESNKLYAAVAVLDSARTLFGREPRIMLYQQDLYRKLNLHDKAIEIGESMVKNQPNNPSFNIRLAESYAANKQLDKASEYFDNAKMIDSTSLEYQASIMEFYRNYGSVSQYMSSLNNLFANKDLDLKAKIDYFNAEIKKPNFYQNNYFQVESLINTLRATHAGDWDVDVLYATHLINSGKTGEASTVYKRYLDDSTHQRKAFEQVIGIETYLKNDVNSLFVYCAKALELFDKDNELKMFISSVFSEFGNTKTAIKLAEECVKNSENDSLKSVYTGYIGDLYHQIDDLKRTYKYYDKALELDSKNIPVLNNYSYFLSIENRKLEKALIMSSKVIDKEPDNPTYIDTYGWILYRLGRYKDAEKAIRRAIALDSTNNSELLLHLGDILAAQGDNFSAQMYWDRAVTNGADKEEVEKRKNSITQ